MAGSWIFQRVCLVTKPVGTPRVMDDHAQSKAKAIAVISRSEQRTPVVVVPQKLELFFTLLERQSLEIVDATRIPTIVEHPRVCQDTNHGDDWRPRWRCSANFGQFTTLPVR